MPSTIPLLTVEGLTVQRGSATAVQDISFSLDARMDMAIIGPNGAGKSTLVQAIMGLLRLRALSQSPYVKAGVAGGSAPS